MVLRITDISQLKIVQVYAPRTSHSDEEADHFYNTIDNALGKKANQLHNYCDWEVEGNTNTSDESREEMDMEKP